jgi:hypothetical protein
MKSIHQLIPDVEYLLEKEKKQFDVNIKLSFGERRDPPYLRLSKAAIDICPCQLWHSIHRPELAEPLPAEALIKFAYGHAIEEMALTFAKEAGHSVLGEQDELVVNGIKGHRDCVLDGYVVDVKSCSSRMFEKIKKKALSSDDTFGYLDQLDGYMVGSFDDDLVRVKDVAYIFAIDKVSGRMTLYEHRLRKDSFLKRLEINKAVVQNHVPPMCTCKEVTHGESGNYTFDVKGSYNPFKRQCKPGGDYYLYHNGAVYLTRVRRPPRVPKLVGGHWISPN